MLISPYTLREPPRSANLEVLEVQDEQTESMIKVCRRAANMGREAI